MIKELIKLADHLDSRGYHGEADFIDLFLKFSSDDPYPEEEPDEEGWGQRSRSPEVRRALCSEAVPHLQERQEVPLLLSR